MPTTRKETYKEHNDAITDKIEFFLTGEHSNYKKAVEIYTTYVEDTENAESAERIKKTLESNLHTRIVENQKNKNPQTQEEKREALITLLESFESLRFQARMLVIQENISKKTGKEPEEKEKQALLTKFKKTEEILRAGFENKNIQALYETYQNEIIESGGENGIESKVDRLKILQRLVENQKNAYFQNPEDVTLKLEIDTTEQDIEELKQEMQLLEETQLGVGEYISYREMRGHKRNKKNILFPSRLACMDTIKSQVKVGNPILLEGESGTGKTHMAESVAQDFTGYTVIKIPIDENISLTSLMSKTGLQGGNTKERYSPLAEAMSGMTEEGGDIIHDGKSVFIDEFNILSPAKQNEIIAFVEKCKPGKRVTHPVTGETFVVRPNFFFIAAINPNQYGGGRNMGPEIRRKFGEIKVDYLEQSAENPELYEFLLTQCLDDEYRPIVDMKYLSPDYREVDKDEKDLTKSWNKVALVGDGPKDKVSATGGFLWRYANMLHQLNLSFQGLPTTFISEQRRMQNVLDIGKVAGFIEEFKQGKDTDIQKFMLAKTESFFTSGVDGKKTKQDLEILKKLIDLYFPKKDSIHVGKVEIIHFEEGKGATYKEYPAKKEENNIALQFGRLSPRHIHNLEVEQPALHGDSTTGLPSAETVTLQEVKNMKELLERDYTRNHNTHETAGFLTELTTGEKGVVYEDKNNKKTEYPFPTEEKLKAVFETNKELIARKMSQFENPKLLITPIALPLMQSLIAWQKTITENKDNLKTIDGAKVAVKDEYTTTGEFEKGTEAVWIWTPYGNEDNFVYYPKAYDADEKKRGGETKDELIARVGGYMISIVDDSPIPRAGKATEKEGRTPMEAGKTPKEYHKALQDAQKDPTSPYYGEVGQIPQEGIYHALSRISEDGRVIDNYGNTASEESANLCTGAYVKGSDYVPRLYWFAGSRQAGASRRGVVYAGGDEGVRSSVLLKS